jgi:two-component system chemotaxis sensor kinase CheA
MNFDDVLPAFVAEAAELLREMEDGLLQCTRGTPSDETINLIFRSAHTIKGSAGLFGLDAIVSFVHGVETLLDRVRLGEIALGPQLVQALLDCKDHIAVLVAGAPEAKHGVDPELLARSAQLLKELNAAAGGAGAEADALAAGAHGDAAAGTVSGAPAASSGAVAAADGGAPVTSGAASAGSDASAPRGAASAGGGAASAAAAGAGSAAGAGASGAAAGGWKISLSFSPDVLLTGMDPLAFIRYLTTFGKITKLLVVEDNLPALSRLNPHKCYLSFEIELQTQEDQSRVEAAFEFVRDDCTLKIQPLVVATTNGGEQALPLRSEHGSTRAGASAGASSTTSSPSSQSRVTRATPGAESTTLRVDAARLDSLITRIGELIIAAAGASTAARRSGAVEVEESLSVLTSLVEEVRGSALQLRMVKNGETFSRFGRVVHDVSRELGKAIELQVSGEDTELDKTLVEKIADPLTHLVRNAIDHGIEPADVRAARGKPAAGVVRLNAYHDSVTIVIEESDDVGGL